MSLLKTYNLEKHSVFDLKNFVEKKGYKTKKVFFRQSLAEKVIELEVYLEYPVVSLKIVRAPFRFRNNKGEENYEEGKKLYNALQRAFPFKDEEMKSQKFSGKIKDLKNKLKDGENLEVLQWYQPRPHFLNPRRKPYIINLKTGERKLFQKYYEVKERPMPPIEIE